MNPKALYNITYGLYFLAAKQDGRDNACIINTAAQIANDPTRIGIAVIQKNLTHDMIMATGEFNISALSTDAPFGLFKRFGMQSGRSANKFDGFDAVQRAENGLLRLNQYANAWFSCKVVDKIDLGSHTYFIGEMTDCEVLSSTPSCTYGYYQSNIKPKPVQAVKKGWVCSVCGYVYDGEDMPEDFICPLCKHGKKDFVPTDAKPEPKSAEKSATIAGKWVCSVCGYVHEGETAPDFCPQCKVPAEKFVQQTGEKSWAAEHIVGVAQGAPEDVLEGLRANFTGECTEVGMYLAMARVAHREGLPQIGEYWHKAGWEEAEHAAKFAELLGEVVSDSTKKNLELRVEAENGATAGKVQLAEAARKLGLDAIADTVMEMAKDEARHGKALAGLLARYFK